MNLQTEVLALLCVLVLAALWFVWQWFRAEPGQAMRQSLRSGDALLGFVTNFFDTLGIGSFALTTAFFKLRNRMSDEAIPGTLNVGHCVPTTIMAVIFVATVTIDVVTLVSMIVAAVVGAWLGAGVISGLPKRAIQLGMGMALLIAATLFIATNLQLMPGGGDALELGGPVLLLAVTANFVLGALMMLGIGLYAPCLILVSVLGMNPLAAFPIMMGSCALLMPIGGARFVRSGKYHFGAALGLALGGIPGVLIAAFIVKSLPLEWLRWLVVVVVLYAAVMMLASARQEREGELRAERAV